MNFPDWMIADAQTILSCMDDLWPTREWPHEVDAVEKLERLLKVIAESSPLDLDK